MDPKFGGVIWTKHALARLQERGIKQGDAWAAFQRPDQSRYAKTQGAWVYYKTYGNEKIEVVAKENERKEWIILTVWSRPLYQHGYVNTSHKQKSRGLLGLLRRLLNI